MSEDSTITLVYISSIFRYVGRYITLVCSPAGGEVPGISSDGTKGSEVKRFQG